MFMPTLDAVGRRGASSYRTHKAAPARKSRRAAFRRVFARASRTGRSGRPALSRGARATKEESDTPAENCLFNPTCFCLMDSLAGLPSGGGGSGPTCTPQY